jgi:ubiquinone biosynthesis protein COQ4
MIVRNIAGRSLGKQAQTWLLPTVRQLHHSAVRASSSGSSSQVHDHVYTPLSKVHKLALGFGSLLASFYNPARGDMIALLSELSGERRLPRLREMMLESEEGRALLMERPALNSQSIDMQYIGSLPEGTFGKQYWKWLKWCNVGPDTRGKVQFIEDPELAYVMQRYRECHDFYHVMCSMPVSHLGETVVKIFEASHMGLPVAFLSSIAGPVRLRNEERLALLGSSGTNGLASWAWRTGRRSKPLIGVRWEQHWERDFSEMQKALGFDEPPPFEVQYTGRSKSTSSNDLAKGRWPSKVLERRTATTTIG